jgi:hypothetical protein
MNNSVHANTLEPRQGIRREQGFWEKPQERSAITFLQEDLVVCEGYHPYPSIQDPLFAEEVYDLYRITLPLQLIDMFEDELLFSIMQ